MKLIDLKSEVRLGLEVWVVRINGVEHCSHWSPQAAERVVQRLLGKVGRGGDL